MQRFGGRLSLVAAALAGYVVGTCGGGRADAARDPVRELLDEDREFDAATARSGVEGWVPRFAPDGIMMPSGGDMVVGQEAVRAFVTKAFAAPGFSMRWEPMDAAASGDLGYTYGVSKVVRTGADGKPAVAYGKYVTIWRRQRDHSWRIVMDIGNASPAPAASKKE